MSSISVSGTVEKQGFGTGTWALISDGATYELKDPPPELCQSDLKARVTGVIRDDVMTIAMIGPVLEVQSFEMLE
ncbi:MAG: hypothetical protein F6K40_24965 [Okeania sp. SIO3I5]|uniref:hypothetical protein n=1 Tax=Okeania sp. SIO3I5 TaxID=2607805 RepID=UPI0013B95E30|nr:hypothetical protein [Okeania sp. SIO3I5]NEQ39326.1 hypothetical protein [Okeania sp. SIO3I5]